MNIDRILIFTLTFLIFSNVINYMSKANLFFLTSVHLFLLTAIIALYFVFKNSDPSFIHIKLNWWIVFYVCVILLWYILPHNEYSIEELRRKILSIASILIFMIFIYYDDENTSTVRQALLFTTLLATFNNIFEFMNPFAFFPIDSMIGVLGRSAGFYINPTISGGAIVLGTILSITYIKRSYRIWYMLFSSVGVFLTFSRSAIVGFMLVYLYMTIKRKLDFKYMVFIPIVLFVVFTLSLPFLTTYIEKNHSGGANNIINRIMWFTNPVEHADKSTSEREKVATKAFKMFTEHPFVGSGLGSTVHWNERVSTHNIYLTHIAEIGLLGLLIYPLLLYSIILQARDETKITAGAFASFTLFIGFFSHNLLDELYMLFAFALMANLSYKSLQKSEDV